MKEGEKKEMTDGRFQELFILARIDELDRIEQSVRRIDGTEAIIKLINERKEELRPHLRTVFARYMARKSFAKR